MNRYSRCLTCALLLSLTLIASAKCQDQPRDPANPAKSTKTLSGHLKLDLYRDYLILVQASSSGHYQLNFLVDTGADPTILDRRVAEELKLHPFAAGKVTDLNGVALGESAVLPDLQVGPIHSRNLTVLISDLSFLEKSLNVRIDGMIGIDVLGQNPFTIDYTTKEINFSELSPLDFSVPLQVSQHFLTVEISLNGQPCKLMLDTGASSLMLFSTRVEGLLSSSQGSIIKHSTNLSGQFQRLQIQLKDLTLGDALIGETPGFVVANQKQAADDFDGLLNPVSVGITRIGIDPQRQVITFNLNRSASPPPSDFHGPSKLPQRHADASVCPRSVQQLKSPRQPTSLRPAAETHSFPRTFRMTLQLAWEVIT